MRLTPLIIAMLCISTVSAYHTTGDYNPQTITGDFMKYSRSLGYKQRFGECHWEKAKGTVCTWNEEELPRNKEIVVQGRPMRDLATTVSPWGSQRSRAINSFEGTFSNFKVKDSRRFYDRYFYQRQNTWVVKE